MNNSVFDILGPIMIGPSSSHTAGAQKLGKAARMIAGTGFQAVEFILHGSFAHTYKGHGTDRALVAGILGMDTDDERMKDALETAQQLGLKVRFSEGDLGDIHPNTVCIILHMSDSTEKKITGSSTGGGNIRIIKIDDDTVELDGKYPAMIVKHEDRKGMISRISSVIASGDINIATLRVSRTGRGDVATTITETDNPVPPDVMKKIQEIPGVYSVRVMDAL